jgi:hypothetical protein
MDTRLTTEYSQQRLLMTFWCSLTKKLNKDINYSIHMEPGVQTCEETEQNFGKL